MQIHTCKKINDTNYRLIKSTKSIAIKTLACCVSIFQLNEMRKLMRKFGGKRGKCSMWKSL